MQCNSLHLINKRCHITFGSWQVYFIPVVSQVYVDDVHILENTLQCVRHGAQWLNRNCKCLKKKNKTQLRNESVYNIKYHTSIDCINSPYSR